MANQVMDESADCIALARTCSDGVTVNRMAAIPITEDEEFRYATSGEVLNHFPRGLKRTDIPTN